MVRIFYTEKHQSLRITAKKPFSVFLEKKQVERLNILSAYTSVPKAVYIREAFDIVCTKYEKQLMGNKKRR